ncbi:MAG: DUF1553 domain-containing protein [Planctomycetes bacterium]|nr:DUF1553 domain-containing protein [Planctomycetota bacterium]
MLRFSQLAVAVALAWPIALPASAQPAPQADNHWAFQKLRVPPLPEVSAAPTPVDAFVLQRLHATGLNLAPQADRFTLVRRLSFDLIGLPPTPEQTAAFLDDVEPGAYERLVDRLLASPHFGERWGRHWLDAAGYVDVSGTDNDAGIVSLSPGKWRYRDYVIRSFNEDRPLAEFLTEQLAGDELVDWRSAPAFTPEMRDKLIATGFLRHAADDTEAPELNTPDIRHGVLQRTGEVLTSNLVALTINCAKCHDHPFEPITQKDYYRMLANLSPAFNPDAWLQPGKRALPDLAPRQKAEFDKYNAALDGKIAELKKRKETKGIADLERQRKKWGLLQVAYDVGPATPFRLLKRGNHLKPGAEVPAGFVQVLDSESRRPAAKPPAAKPQGATSGRRLALAHWLTNPDSPASALVLRAQVNRVWQHLFGRGIVVSTDNLGVSGSRPSHPELLDWLASAYRANGGRLKPLLRLLVASAAYRQAAAGAENEVAQRRDPDNRLLWRMPLRRLEAEAVRDALLVVSGKLDRSFFGEPIPTEGGADGRFIVKTAGLPANISPWRRSIYLLARRNYHPTLLNVFDQPLMNTNCLGRSPSAVVLQSLTMLNDDFVVAQAHLVARRVIANDDGQRISAAYGLVLGRAPRPGEMELCREYLARQRATLANDQLALTHLCHMLLNTSEFLYVP